MNKQQINNNYSIDLLEKVSKDIRLFRMNEFNKTLEENNGIPMLLSYMYFDDDEKGFQLDVDFPYHIFDGGQITGTKNNVILTEEEVLIYVIDSLEVLIKKLKKRLLEEQKNTKYGHI